MKSLIVRVVALVLALNLVGAAAFAAKPSTTDPVPRADEWWTKRHESFNEAAKKGDVGLLMIGDSITHGWEGHPELWERFFGKYKPLNLGIGGDQTQHVLWRLDHGNIDGLSPKAAVLMIGTNNSNGEDYTAEEISEGIVAIVNKLRERLPETKVLILAIFPRGEGPSPQREKNAKASELASKIVDDENVFYLDIGQEFLEEDQTLTKEIMPDLLHLSDKGYEIWGEAVTPKLKELMGE